VQRAAAANGVDLDTLDALDAGYVEPRRGGPHQRLAVKGDEAQHLSARPSGLVKVTGAALSMITDTTPSSS
jgi:hypothetical protein